MQLFNLQQMRLVSEPVTGTKCLVAWGDNSLVISFRGTANLQNAIGDLQVHQPCFSNVLHPHLFLETNMNAWPYDLQADHS